MFWNALASPGSFPLYLQTDSSPIQIPVTYCKKTTKKMPKRAAFVFVDERASSLIYPSYIFHAFLRFFKVSHVFG